MSTPSSDSADSNDLQHEVTITEAMLKEEEKLEEETQAKEKEKIAQLKAKVIVTTNGLILLNCCPENWWQICSKLITVVLSYHFFFAF